MINRRIDGFFYGLFMDEEVLEGYEVQAVNPRHGFVEGFSLRIGRRATLVPEAWARAYGMVFSLTHDDLERLYTAPGLEIYYPEAVLVRLMDGDPLPALCYNLREAPAPDESNADYATRLRATLSKLEFPADYVASVS